MPAKKRSYTRRITVDTKKALIDLYAGTRQFYARPCDEPRKGWCVAEVQLGAKGAKWESTLYEPALIRLKAGSDSILLTGMTQAQAKQEAELWNRRTANGKASKGKG